MRRTTPPLAPTLALAGLLASCGGSDRASPPPPLPADRALLVAMADTGSAPAMARLGQLFESGSDSLPADLDSADAWFAKAAAAGHPEGCYGRARVLRWRSNDTERLDSVRALLEEASRLGHPGATNDLAAMDFFGQGTGRPDTARAVAEWKAAAELGNPQAMFNYGMALYSGQGVPKDLVEAYVWWWVAAELGNAGAQNNRLAATKEMDPDAILDAQRTGRGRLEEVRRRLDAYAARWGLPPEPAP